MSQSDALPDLDWRGGQTYEQLRVSRSLILWVTWLLAVVLIVGVGYLLYRVLTFKSEKTFLVTIVTEGSDVDRLTCPPIEYQSQTRQSLAELPTLATASEDESEVLPLADVSYTLEAARSVYGFGNWIQGKLDQWDPKSFWGQGRRVVIVYVCAQGLVVGDKAYFLGGDFSLADDAGRCEVGDVLEQIAACEADVKLVLVDTGRLPPDPRIGVALDEFPQRLAREVARQEDDSLWVLCAYSPGETARLDYAQHRTRFGSSVARALQGDADLKQFGGNDDKSVSLDELYGFVLRQCAPGQTPFLVRGNSAREDSQPDGGGSISQVDRTIPSTLHLLRCPSPPSESGEPSGATKLATKVARSKTSKFTSPVKQQGAKVKSLERKAARLAPKSDQAKAAGVKPDAADGAKADAVAEGDAATGASPTPADTNWLDRLGVAWDLHDNLANPPQTQWAPAMFMPQVWRNVDAWLCELEQRIRFGSDDERAAALDSLGELIVSLESLQALVASAPTTPRSHSPMENRLTSVWDHFDGERSAPESLRYVSSFRDPLAGAMRTYQLLLFRAVYYVRWYDRACRSKANPLEQYADVDNVLLRLGDAGRMLSAESPQGDLTRLQGCISDIQMASQNLDTALAALAIEAAGKISDPEYQAACEALLSQPLLPATTRMKLVRALNGLADGDGAASEAVSPFEPKTTWGDPAPLNSVQLSRLVESLTLQVKLIRLFSPTSADEVQLFVKKIDASLPLDTQSAAVQDTERALQAFYAGIPNHLERFGVSADERQVSGPARLLLRIVDPRDVELNATQKWTAATGLIALPTRLEPSGPETANILLSPDAGQFKFRGKDLATPLTIDFEPERFSDQPLTARIAFAPGVVELSDAATGKAVSPDAAVPVPLGSDNKGRKEFVLSARETKGGAAGGYVTMTIHLARGEGAGALPAGSKSVRLPLPPEDDVLLGCRRDGLPDNAWMTSAEGMIELRPFANRDSSFQFALRNTSEKQRTVTVELFAVKRPRGASWAPGWIPNTVEQKEQYKALLFDRGGSGTRPDVTRVAPPASVTLSPDPEKWELIAFGKEEAKAEPDAKPGGGASGQDPNKKDAAAAAPEAGPLATHGLVCRISDPQAGENWTKFKWIAIVPLRPSAFLEAKAKYEDRDRHIVVEVRAREVVEDGQRRFWLPAGLDKQPVQLSLVPESGFGRSGPQEPYNGWLTDAASPVTLALDTPDDVWNSAGTADFRVALGVDQWPRAMAFTVRCKRKEDAEGIELRTRKEVEITRISSPGDEWVYIFGQNDTAPPVSAPAADPNKRPPILLSPLAGPAYFPARFADERLTLDFRVDVPTTSFVIPDGREAILVQSNQGDLAGPFYADRQMTARVREFREGWLVLRTDVGDYSVELAPTRDKEKVVPIEVALKLQSLQSAGSGDADRVEARKAEVFMDGQAPAYDQLPLPEYLPRESARTLGATVHVTLTLQDDSGIDRVEYLFYREGTPPEAVPVPKDRIRSSGAKHVITIDIPSDPEKQEPGVYQLRVRAVDRVQNELLTPPVPVTLRKPKPPSTKPANLTIVGVVQLKGSGIRKEKAEVTLTLNGQAIDKRSTDEKGEFRFEDLEDGNYAVSATCVHKYRDCTGSVTPVKPLAQWPNPLVIEVSSSN